MAADGYTVRAAELASGGRRAARLAGGCERVAGLITAELEALAVAAGSPAVESAARRVAESAAVQFLNAASGYRHSARELARTAAAYARAEDDAAASVGRVAADGGVGTRPVPVRWGR